MYSRRPAVRPIERHMRVPKDIRILLSGPGLIGSKHAELLQSNPHARIVAVVAPGENPLPDALRSETVPRYATIEDALKGEMIDAAIISSPNEFHHDQVMRCIEARLPTLVEKPLTDRLETAARLVEASDRHNVPVLVGHHRTYSPFLRLAREFLSSDAFGKPVTLQGSALFTKPDAYFAAGPWRTKPGGGLILINLVHEIGIMRYLFGEVDRVTASLSNVTRGFEVEDSAAITFSFENGALGTFILSDTSASDKSWEMTAGENPAYPHFPDQNCYHFSGTNGSLDFPSMRYKTYEGCAERSWWSEFNEGRLPSEPIDPLSAQLQHFVDVIRGTAVPLVPTMDGYRNMVVLEAIRIAAREERTVALSEILQ